MAAAAPYAESAPPRFLRLAGHPLRWRLLRELAWSDRRAGELCDLAGRGQSLVSYHLRQLRDGGLVSTRRSVADGRDTYYVLDLARCGELLRSAGVSLHPGLAPRPDPQPPGISPGTWHRSRQVRSAKFSRALSTWRNEMFPFPQIAGSRRALGVSRLPDDLPYVDLDDAPTLVARGMRPTQVIERNRPYTQAKALQIYREKQWSGIRFGPSTGDSGVSGAFGTSTRSARTSKIWTSRTSLSATRQQRAARHATRRCIQP